MKKLLIKIIVAVVLLIPMQLQDNIYDLGPCLLGPACDKEAA